MREVYKLPEVPTAQEGPSTSTDYSQHSNDSLVIDNGSHSIRAGWNVDARPRIHVENITSRFRERKTNHWCVLAGQECYLDTQSRSQIKSAFEQDVVCNFDAMEHMLDYVFCRLGISDDSVANPVYLTEPLTNPRASRTSMTELLFECYNAPSVSYSVDSLQAFNYTGLDSGIVVSSANHSTHVIPVLDGKAHIHNARKFAWGASTASEYLLKLMQMKYPAFPGRLTNFQSNLMYKEHSFHTLDYSDAIRKLASPSAIVEMDRVIQFPFVAQVWEEKTEEELAKIAERKKEAARRLQEQLAKQRLEKLVRQEDEYAMYSKLRDDRSTMKKAEWDQAVRAAGFDSAQDLEQYVEKLNKTITRLRAKEAGIALPEEQKEEPTFPLVDVPDHQLNEEDLKEKRKQRLLKASYDARQRMKEEKEREQARIERERVEDERLRREDLGAWTRKVRQEHEAIMERIRERKKRKEQLADRKSLAAQNRMKSIASLAADGKGRKRKRGAQEKDDEFGRNDEDWLIYREIDNANDSDDEEEDTNALRSVEDKLLEFDPTFSIDDTSERKAMKKHALLNAFIRGMGPEDPLDSFDPQNVEHTSQLHMNIERIRVPEVVWQPSIAGIDAAGITELVSNILRNYNAAERSKLVQNIFTTGGNTLVPYFDARLTKSLTSVLPVGTQFNIVKSADDLQAWRGMAKWSTTPEGVKSRFTRQEYEEYGAEYLKPSQWGNR